MIEDTRINTHKIIIENRKNINITDVKEVISFDEEMIVCDTGMGVLILKGSGLHVNNLNLAKGDLLIDGEIVSMNYDLSGAAKPQSFISKIFK